MPDHSPLPFLKAQASYFVDLVNAPFSRRRKRLYKLRHTYSQFGKFTGKLSKEQHKLWSQTFETAETAYFKKLPSLKTSKAETPAVTEPFKVSIVMTRFIGCEAHGIENDFTSHFSASARAAGLDCQTLHLDHLYRPDADFETECASIARQLEEHKPDLVVFDGNIPRGPGEFNSERIANLRHRLNFKTLCVIGDLYDIRQEDCLSHWQDCSDLFLIFNKRSKHFLNFTRRKDVLVKPFLPFCEDLFHPQDEKHLDFYYCGARSRQREEFLNALRSTDLNYLTRFHNRTTTTAVPVEIYHKELASARMTFGNGYINAHNNIITGRVGEAILSRTLVLYEDGSDLSDYLFPFVHYVPVQTIHDFCQAAIYLKSNPSLISNMVDAAHSFWHEHYSSRLFWARLRALTAPAIDKGAS